MAEQFLEPGARGMQPPSSKRDREFAVSKRSRGRSGCLNCRRRRKKCDEGKPACVKCTMRSESCEWDTRITFRLSGIDTYDPSKVQPRELSTQNKFQFMNVAFENGTVATQHTYTEDAMSQHSSSSSNDQVMSDANGQERNNTTVILRNHEPTPIASSRDTARGLAHENSSLAKDSRFQISRSSSTFYNSNDVLGQSSTASSKSSHYGSPDERVSNTSNLPGLLPQISPSAPAKQTSEYPSQQVDGISKLNCSNSLNNDTITQTQSVALISQLEALDYLTTQPNHYDFFSSGEPQSGLIQYYSKDSTNIMPSPFSNGLAMAESPDRQPVPYSSATYQDLHTTLYHHMLETVRNTTKTRNATPDPIPGVQSIAHNNVISPPLSVMDDMRSQAREPNQRLQPLKLVKLTKRRQLELWRNYLDEIAVWLDMFDNDRHFQYQIPHLAKSADHLQYSILALSARQMERKTAGKPYTESLALYQEAIQLIVKELYTLDTTVIASCVLLCVLEMMSSSPKAWCRHLDGCAMLLEAAGVNGIVGGVRESLFWCFARMDVWGGYLEDTLTKIPTSRWFIPSGSMMEAVTYLKAGSGSHSHANYAVFLCASVVNVISDKTGEDDAGKAEVDSTRRGTYAARWQALFDLLEDWYNNRTEEMQPLMTFASGSEDSRDPFSTILYGSSPAINGNQLYHAAALFLLQNKPKGLRLAKSSRSILWHARQICGIAVSNSDHGALINCLQPLWIAGKLMSHKSEHSAILDLLAQIEKNTGWATAWRAEDLKDYWGDVGYSDEEQPQTPSL